MAAASPNGFAAALGYATVASATRSAEPGSDMVRTAGNVWFVTGASSGIGLAMACRLHMQGRSVFSTGRRAPAKLPADFPGIPYVSADLRREAERSMLVQTLPDALDYAILNAGVGFYRPLEAEDSGAIGDVLAVDLLAPIDLAHRLFTRLDRGSGTLVLVGSVAWRGSASMPVYAAAKGALDGFARSLRSEWAGRVDVRIVHPGPTATGMAERAGLRSKHLGRLMLPVDDVAAGVLAASTGRSRLRRTISYGAVLRAHLSGRSR